MIQYESLQIYWWFLISVLGAVLVFLLFVQGGQTMLLSTKNDAERSMMVNSLGRKWEFTFTSLVVFGGAFFASFPLFYSTSFGGAYWLWVIILFSFVIQATAYEFRSKPGNIFGRKTYDCFLMINGVAGCILLGVAVAMFFFGAEFQVNRQNILNASAPVISTWSPTHGLEAILCWKNILLGFTILFLARTSGSLYFINNIEDNEIYVHQKKRLAINSAIFVVLFLAFVAVLLTSTGYTTISNEPNAAQKFVEEPFKYLNNILTMWWTGLMILAGVAMILFSLAKTLLKNNYRRGIWWFGFGTVLVVLALFFIAGYNNTPYYPSLLDPESSLTIYNSSSSEFTLTVMSVVSIIIPFVLGYIFYAWHSMDKVSITRKEMIETKHKY